MSGCVERHKKECCEVFISNKCSHFALVQWEKNNKNYKNFFCAFCVLGVSPIGILTKKIGDLYYEPHGIIGMCYHYRLLHCVLLSY